MDAESVRPDAVRDKAEFVQLLRLMKDQSGYTFRQLEHRAASHGEVLARSTVADMLGRPGLPRAELLAAFVRACTGDDNQVAAWLATLNRLVNEADAANGNEAPPGQSAQVTDQHAPERARAVLWRTLVRAAAGVTVAALLAVGGWLLVRDTGESPRAREAGPAPKSRLALPAGGSVVRIHPARTPALCLTEGREHTGRYDGAVAVQRSCEDAEPPRTLLVPVDGDRFQIKWSHPQHGVGCLTVLASGSAAGMLEPWNDCAAGGPTQLFRVESVAAPLEGYRLRPVHSELCLGIRGGETVSGAELVQEPCTGEGDQTFRVDVVASAS
ncbi:RICIN domain-containing protein [Micromonospora sp. NPDC049101]|uniref:RICIN domain-containing protein n=1 Tax=Micromonospora sp. NPDC049101 TaxID=3155032 RepID=UPI0033C319AB